MNSSYHHPSKRSSVSQLNAYENTTGLLVHPPTSLETIITPRVVQHKSWSVQSPWYMENVLVDSTTHGLVFKEIEDHAMAPWEYFPAKWLRDQPYPGYTYTEGLCPVSQRILKKGLSAMGFRFNEPVSVFDAALSLLQVWNAQERPLRRKVIQNCLAAGGGLTEPGLTTIIDSFLLPPAHEKEFRYLQTRVQRLVASRYQGPQCLQPGQVPNFKRRKISEEDTESSSGESSDSDDV